MVQKFVPPSYKADGFNCPHCGWYAQQRWATGITLGMQAPNGTQNTNLIDGDKLHLSRCSKCQVDAFWTGQKLIHPRVSLAVAAHEDLPSSVLADYEEARKIAAESPRAAAALLRLLLQKLCGALGETGKDINSDIGSLVRKGLPARIQQALDILRVVGNESVHPGTMDLRDDADTVNKLFSLVNLIVQDRITEPKEIGKLYNSLPADKRKGIEGRDKQSIASPLDPVTGG